MEHIIRTFEQPQAARDFRTFGDRLQKMSRRYFYCQGRFVHVQFRCGRLAKDEMRAVNVQQSVSILDPKLRVEMGDAPLARWRKFSRGRHSDTLSHSQELANLNGLNPVGRTFSHNR